MHGKHVDEEVPFQGLLRRVGAVCLPPFCDLLGVVTSALGGYLMECPNFPILSSHWLPSLVEK